MGIGLPVRNGERYLREAVDSVLAQDYPHFELVIVDNASDDGTEAIARGYARADSRVLYHRQPRNLGAVPNFNAAFERAGGSYFKWLAHDDRLAPDYLRRCVEALESDPTVSLCHSWVEVIDDEGLVLEQRGPYLPGAESTDVAERVGAITHHDRDCFDIFGVVRREVLEKTGTFEPYVASDRTLRLRIGLQGRFREIPAFLTQIRDHSGRSTRAMPAHHQRAKWFHAENRESWIFPHWRVLLEYARVLAGDPRARRSPASWWQLIRWPFRDWNLVRMAADVLIAVFPASWKLLFAGARRLGVS